MALDISLNSINKLFGDDIKVNDENYSLEDTVEVIDLGFFIVVYFVERV